LFPGTELLVPLRGAPLRQLGATSSVRRGMADAARRPMRSPMAQTTTGVLGALFLGVVALSGCTADDRAPDPAPADGPRRWSAGAKTPEALGVREWAVEREGDGFELSGFGQAGTVVHAVVRYAGPKELAIDVDKPEPWHGVYRIDEAAVTGTTAIPPAIGLALAASVLDAPPLAPEPTLATAPRDVGARPQQNGALVEPTERELVQNGQYCLLVRDYERLIELGNMTMTQRQQENAQQRLAAMVPMCEMLSTAAEREQCAHDALRVRAGCRDSGVDSRLEQYRNTYDCVNRARNGQNGSSWSTGSSWSFWWNCTGNSNAEQAIEEDARRRREADEARREEYRRRLAPLFQRPTP
jgi:hypothetical protein